MRFFLQRFLILIMCTELSYYLSKAELKINSTTRIFRSLLLKCVVFNFTEKKSVPNSGKLCSDLKYGRSNPNATPAKNFPKKRRRSFRLKLHNFFSHRAHLGVSFLIRRPLFNIYIYIYIYIYICRRQLISIE